MNQQPNRNISERIQEESVELESPQSDLAVRSERTTAAIGSLEREGTELRLSTARLLGRVDASREIIRRALRG